MCWHWECRREHLCKWLINIISQRDNSITFRVFIQQKWLPQSTDISFFYNCTLLKVNKNGRIKWREKILLVWINSLVIQVTTTPPPPRSNFCSQFNFQGEEKRNTFLTSVQVIFLFLWGFVFIHTSHIKVHTSNLLLL